MPDTGSDADQVRAEEHQRIRDVDAEYEAERKWQTIWADTKASRFMRDGKWRAVLAALRDCRASFEDAWCVDLGSGATGDAWRLGEYERTARGIVAFDLIHTRLTEARRLNPSLVAVAADAARMPFPDKSIGVVYQSTMLSSVLDSALRTRTLAEVRRVLKGGGVFISYDTRYPNPWNPNTRPVSATELQRAFAGWSFRSSSLTGIPQMVRFLAPISMTACRLLEAFPPLRSHLLFVACRPTLGC